MAAPAWARERQMAWPMPLPAPVTTARRPVRSMGTVMRSLLGVWWGTSGEAGELSEGVFEGGVEGAVDLVVVVVGGVVGGVWGEAVALVEGGGAGGGDVGVDAG